MRSERCLTVKLVPGLYHPGPSSQYKRTALGLNGGGLTCSIKEDGLFFTSEASTQENNHPKGMILSHCILLVYTCSKASMCKPI